MNLDELRCEIDRIDDSLVTLFGQRMNIAAQIAEYKGVREDACRQKFKRAKDKCKKLMERSKK